MKNKICKQCGHIGTGKHQGSFLITLILLCCWIVPGVIYEIWRMNNGECLCKNCGAKQLIPHKVQS